MVDRLGFLWFLAACLIVFPRISVGRDVACYKCSWTGTQELNEEKEEALEDALKDMESKTVPIDNPLTSPFIESKVVPDKRILDGHCSKCHLPGGLCVSWTFILNNVVQNATYMCVKSVTDGVMGIFEQEMPDGSLKKVVICNVDYCNSSKAERIATPSLYLNIMLSVFSLIIMLRVLGKSP